MSYHLAPASPQNWDGYRGYEGFRACTDSFVKHRHALSVIARALARSLTPAPQTVQLRFVVRSLPTSGHYPFQSPHTPKLRLEQSSLLTATCLLCHTKMLRAVLWVSRRLTLKSSKGVHHHRSNPAQLPQVLPQVTQYRNSWLFGKS